MTLKDSRKVLEHERRVEVVKNFMTNTVGLVRYLEDNLPVPASDLFS